MYGEKRPARTFNYQEIKQLILNIPEARDQFLIAVMYANGARIGEAIGVRAEDIDWDKDFLYIILPVLKKRQEIPPKRSPPIYREKEAWLANIIINYSFNKKGHLYPYTIRTAQKRINKYLNCTSHSLRHSRVTHCLTKLGMGMLMVQEYFKISPSFLTQWVNIYGHLDTGDLKRHLKNIGNS